MSTYPPNQPINKDDPSNPSPLPKSPPTPAAAMPEPIPAPAGDDGPMEDL